MRHARPLQQQLLADALKSLRAELASMEASEKSFLAHYRTARLRAFELEFLAKFLRKASVDNRETFENLQAHSKQLEDRLGDFNELDEMLGFVKGKEMILPSGLSVEQHFKNLRRERYTELVAWLSREGWFGPAKDQTALQKIEVWLGNLEWITDQELRSYSVKKMAKTLRELQDEVDRGSFSPKRKSGYQLSEVEPRVHEARREIRKIAMYAGYLRGLFALTAGKKNVLKGSRLFQSSVKYFQPLADGPVGQSDFSRLPPKSVENPILIPRPFFVAITKYVSELGVAKDWAQNLDRLIKAGLPGNICFDQLDPTLKDVFARPTPFNALVLSNLKEMKTTQLFRLTADFLEDQKNG